MKKILALILSLLMVFSLGMAAFGLDLVELEPVVGKEPELAKLERLELNYDAEEGYFHVRVGKGSTYYIMLDPSNDYKDIKVTGNGAVSAKILKYDPEVYEPIDDVYYTIASKLDKDFDPGEDFRATTYEAALAEKERLNKENRTTVYYVKSVYPINLVEIVVSDNFSAAYTEGKVKITATLDKKPVAATITVINDVFYYDINNVKWAADGAERKLDDTYIGYSVYDDAATGFNPTVVHKSAFRAIEGKDLTVENALTVKIKDVAAGQPSVNFAAYSFNKVDKNKDKKIDYIEFGFYTSTPIKSAFEVITPAVYSYWDLVDVFDLRLEENDVITYTIYKDGNYYSSFSVDYSETGLNEKISFHLDGKAGETLGRYTIQVGENTNVPPATPSEVEEANPNTGAPVNFFAWLFELIFG